MHGCAAARWSGCALRPATAAATASHRLNQDVGHTKEHRKIEEKKTGEAQVETDQITETKHKKRGQNGALLKPEKRALVAMS